MKYFPVPACWSATASLRKWGVAFLLSGSLLLAGCTSVKSPDASADGDEKAVSKERIARDDEKVNVGYGQQKRRDLTAAVGTVDVKRRQAERSAGRLSELLRGSVAGVRVSRGSGGGITVRIRGNSSIYGSNAPLYVVDGVAVSAAPGGSLPWINPYDVASISVLKDAAATSIYGSRGANGVIVIETKR